MNFICIMKQITDTEESTSQLAKQVDYVMGLHKFQADNRSQAFKPVNRNAQNMYF